MSLSITWLGHAAFLLEAGGLRVLLDPYRAPDAGGYAPINVEADVVLVSHLNPKYHSHWGASSGNPVRLNGLDFADAPEGVAVRDVRFRAVRVWESPARNIPVSMPYFTLGGVSVCHTGDLGHALSEAEAFPLQGIDVLLAVAGGPPTLPVPDLAAAISLIRPRLVIPMHYGNDKINLPLRPVDDLLALFDPSQVEHRSSPTLEVSPDALPSETRIIVLPPLC